MTLTLQSLRARKARHQEALEKAQEQICKGLAKLGALRIILFGSLAEGKVRLHSDLDIICIMPNIHNSKEWKDKIYAALDWEVSCDLLVYNEEELEQTLPVSRFLRRAVKTGKVIYEKRT